MKIKSIISIFTTLILLLTFSLTAKADTSYSNTVYEPGGNGKILNLYTAVTFSQDREYNYYAFANDVAFNFNGTIKDGTFNFEVNNYIADIVASSPTNATSGDSYNVNLTYPFPSIQYTVNDNKLDFQQTISTNEKAFWKGTIKEAPVANFKPTYVFRVPRTTAANIANKNLKSKLGYVYVQFDSSYLQPSHPPVYAFYYVYLNKESIVIERGNYSH